MQADAILDRLEQVLEEEREAIRRLDGPKVEALAKEKEEGVGALAGLDVSERRKVVQRLQALKGDLRRNGILLDHAKRILADILRAKRAELGFSRPGFGAPMPPRPGNRLSIRG